jgi:hypothetical protein
MPSPLPITNQSRTASMYGPFVFFWNYCPQHCTFSSPLDWNTSATIPKMRAPSHARDTWYALGLEIFVPIETHPLYQNLRPPYMLSKLFRNYNLGQSNNTRHIHGVIFLPLHRPRQGISLVVPNSARVLGLGTICAFCSLKSEMSWCRQAVKMTSDGVVQLGHSLWHGTCIMLPSQSSTSGFRTDTCYRLLRWRVRRWSPWGEVRVVG